MYIYVIIYIQYIHIQVYYMYIHIYARRYMYMQIQIQHTFPILLGRGGTRPVIINDRRYKLQMGGGRQLLSPLSATGLLQGWIQGGRRGGAEAFPMYYIYVFTYIYIFIQMQIQIQSVSCIVLCTMWFRSVYSKVYRI